MQKKILFRLALCYAGALMFSNCKKDDTIVQVAPSANDIVQKYLSIDLDAPFNYSNPAYPAHYDANVLANDNAPSINRVTDRGATLGRVLFFDKHLSRNNKTACASCHQQAEAYADEKVFSEGFEGGLTTKHAMRLANANFYTGDRMFWDKRAVDLEAQTTQPIQNAVEMGFDAASGGIDALLQKLKGLEYYPVLFEYAFGSPEITEERMQRALAQYVRSMVSTHSKFDTGFAQTFNPGQPGGGAGAPFANFSQQENMGKNLFLAPPNMGGAGCAGCHQPPTFALAANSLNNGLDANEPTVFKAPSLKNIGITGRYMHDGRFATLDQVVEHYNSGIQPGPNLDNRLRLPNGQPLRLNLSADQKAALVAFLKTLTDEALMTDAKFSDPFKP